MSKQSLPSYIDNLNDKVVRLCYTDPLMPMYAKYLSLPFECINAIFKTLKYSCMTLLDKGEQR